MARTIGLGALLVGFWLLLSGHYDSALLFSLGAASVALVLYLSHRMEIVDDEAVSLYLNPRFWLYIPWLLKEIFVSCVHVARIVLSPSLPISPSMVVFHGSQKTDLGKALYANSITLTPGTITTGIEGQEFQIHALTVEDLETDEESQMNRRVMRVEGSR